MAKEPGTKRPAMGKGHGGPAKGASRYKTLRMAAQYTSDTAHLGHEQAKDGFAKRREAREKWLAEHPEFEGVNSLSPKQLREYLRYPLPPLIDRAVEIGLTDNHPRQLDAIRFLAEQGLGRPPQETETPEEMGIKIEGGLPE